MNLGDQYTFRPSAFCDKNDEKGRKSSVKLLDGRVVYIHPKRRYFTVEAVVHGCAIRECLYFTVTQMGKR